MNVFPALLRTEAPRSFLFLRVFVAADYALDGLRAIRDSSFFGSSRLEQNLGVSSELELVLGALELVCGAFVLLGFLTRIAAALPLVLPLLAAWAALPDVGGFYTSSALDALVVNCGVALIALLLVIQGAGFWSVDAIIAEP